MHSDERAWDFVIRVPEQPIDWERSALIVIDLQNSFATRSCGVFKRLAENGMAEEGEYAIGRLEQTVIPNVVRLADAFRAADRPVVLMRSASLRGDGSDQTARHRGQRLDIPEWSHEAQIVDELMPQRGDLVIVKTGSGCFTGTNLDHLLRNMRVETVVLTGMWTNSCVETTARHAGDLDYRVVLVEDACVAVTPDLHEWSLRYLGDNFATVCSTEEVAARLDRATVS